MKKSAIINRLALKVPNFLYLLCGLACHILVYLEYLYSVPKEHATLRVDWAPQFLVLTIFLCILFVLSFVLSKSRIVIIILSVHFAFILLLAYPVGYNIISILALCMVLVLEAYLHLPKPYDIILSILGPILPFFSLLPHERWDPLLSLPSVYNTMLTMACLLLFVYVTHVAKKETTSRAQQSGDMEILRQNLTRLTLTNLEFQKLATNIGEEATESERKRITREVHDTVGYTLTNVTMAMEAALRLLPPDNDTLSRLLELTKIQARDGLKETRSALYQLRKQEGGKLKGIHAVYRLSALFEEITGIRVILDFGNVPLSLNDAVDEFLFRLIQEGIVNSFKHAKPSEIRIYSHLNSNGMHITILDNGQGCFDLKEGIGVTGIRERLVQFDGQLTIQNNSTGFSLSVFIPAESLHL